MCEVEFKLITYTFGWPWESMLQVFNSFFQHLWVPGTAFPTGMDIHKLHVMVTCTHNFGCNRALTTLVRLGSFCWRPSTNMRAFNSFDAFLQWRVPIICTQHLYMWMKEDYTTIWRKTYFMKWFTSNQGLYLLFSCRCSGMPTTFGSGLIKCWP